MTAKENSVLVINPYKLNGVWVFDDEQKGLDQEPFVSGMGEIIDFMSLNLPSPEKGFTALFSSKQFPSAQFSPAAERHRDADEPLRRCGRRP